MTAVDDWMVRTVDGKLVRGVEVSRHDTSTAGVAVDGWQHQDGTVERYIGLYDVKDMNAAQARDLAAALLAAADELAALEQVDPLDRFTTEEILSEIRRRPGGPEALRALLGDDLGPPFM